MLNGVTLYIHRSLSASIGKRQQFIHWKTPRAGGGIANSATVEGNFRVPATRQATNKMADAQGSSPVTVRKRTGTLRIWRARECEPIWESGGGAPSGVQEQSPWSGGQGCEAPLKLKAFYCRREQICHSHLSET